MNHHHPTTEQPQAPGLVPDGARQYEDTLREFDEILRRMDELARRTDRALADLAAHAADLTARFDARLRRIRADAGRGHKAHRSPGRLATEPPGARAGHAAAVPPPVPGTRAPARFAREPS